MKKLKLTDLSDLEPNTLPDGFSIVFGEDNKPVAAILNYRYYQYIIGLINKVKQYVQKKNSTQE